MKFLIGSSSGEKSSSGKDGILACDVEPVKRAEVRVSESV